MKTDFSRTFSTPSSTASRPKTSGRIGWKMYSGGWRATKRDCTFFLLIQQCHGTYLELWSMSPKCIERKMRCFRGRSVNRWWNCWSSMKMAPVLSDWTRFSSSHHRQSWGPLAKVCAISSHPSSSYSVNWIADKEKDIDNGLTLCLALMARSEVFLKMNDGINGLNDLQLAVKHGLPTKNNSEYYAKLARFYACELMCTFQSHVSWHFPCFFPVLNEDKKCEISIKLYDQLLGSDSRRKELLESEVRDLKEKIASLGGPKQQSRFKPLPGLNSSSSASLDIEKCTSNLKLVESSNAGKYFTADAEIGAAETLLVEKAKCACLYPKNFGTHCYQCFARLVSPIGCTDCSAVAFCSIECRDIALNTYHKFECKYLLLLMGSGMSILCHLALKLVLQCQTPEKALEEGKRLSGILCKNSKMRSQEDFFKRCLMSTFLLRCLQKAEFFGRRTTESAEPTAKESQIGVLLFTYLQALQFNAHEIYETISSGHKFFKARVNYIGVGIYEAGAMFNHECYPSVARFFNSTNLIFNSIRPLKRGEVVAENYGPIFSKQTLPERQRNLASRYWFKCECRACRENWPILDKLNNKCRLRCTTVNCDGFFNYPQNHLKEVKCRLCKRNVSLQLSVNLLSEAEDLFEQGAVFMDVSNRSKQFSAYNIFSYYERLKT